MNSGHSFGVGNSEVGLSSIYLEPSVNASSQALLLCRDSGISSILSDVAEPVVADITAAKHHVYLMLKDSAEDPLQESSRIPDVDHSRAIDVPVYDFIPEDNLDDSGAFLVNKAAIKTSTVKSCMPDVVQGSVNSPLAKQ